MHKLGSHAKLDIAHQLDDTFSTDYAYATTNKQVSVSAREIKDNILNALKKAVGFPQATWWIAASDRSIASLEKHGVYELIHRSPSRTEGDRYERKPRPRKMNDHHLPEWLHGGHRRPCWHKGLISRLHTRSGTGTFV